MKWTTAITKLFPQVDVPIVGAPMAGVSGGLLAAATARAGGLGFIAAGHLQDVAAVEQQIELFRQHAPRHAPLALGFIGHSSLATDLGWQRYQYLLETHQPAAVQFFAPAIVSRDNNNEDDSVVTNVDLARQYNAVFIAAVGSYADSVAAAQAGAPVIMLQGNEGGGHGLRRELGNALLPLLRRVRLALPLTLPLLAAGGIVDGPGMAAMLLAGADGVVLGTRLWASTEAMGHDAVKQRLVNTASGDDVVRTTVLDQIQNTYSSTPWPAPYDSMSVVRNQLTAQWDDVAIPDLARALQADDSIAQAYKAANEAGDPDHGMVLAGQGVGNIASLESAEVIVHQIAGEAYEILTSRPGELVSPLAS